MQKQILYIDMDGVIVDFESGYESFHDRHQQGFFESMKPIDGAINAVEKLSQKYDFYILSTAPWSSPYAWMEKRLWIEKHLGELGFKRLILSQYKNLLKGDFLIDDRIANGVADFEGEHIHFATDRFPNWDSVLEYLIK